MTQPSDLIVDDRLLAPAIEHCKADAAALLAAAATPLERAAAAIVASRLGPAPVEALLPLLDSDGLDARAAAWALGRTASEEPLLQLATDGTLDQRSNAWQALAHRIANGGAGDRADAIHAAVEAEIERHAAGRAGCGEFACRALVLLHDNRAAECIDRLMSADRFCDRFELQRQRKLLDDEQALNEELRDLAADWRRHFADEISDDMPAPGGAQEAEPKEAEVEAVDGEAGRQPTEEMQMPEGAEAIDWDTFLASPEAEGLPEDYLGLIGQLGPAFEQLAGRFVGKGLSSCNEEEVAALFLQVLPQALPPQYVQVALSPQGLGAFKALADYLERCEAGGGSDLQAGLDLVKQQIQAQMRASGNLNSSIYDE